MTSLERYIRAASTYISRDHLENFLKARVVLSPKQLEFCAQARNADNADGPFEVGYGGARGGGKSFGALAQLLADDCQRAVIKALYLRRTGASGREQFEELRWKILKHIPHKYSRHLGTITFPNGSLVVLGHFQADKDVDKYLGLQYDVALVEEATQLTESKIGDIRTCIRTSKLYWKPRMYYVTNPGGIGHNWFVKRICKAVDHKAAFISSRIKDNRLLDDQYEDRLNKDLTGWKHDAWVKGDFNIKAGSYFDIPYNILPSQDVPEMDYYWGALDHGVVHWGVFYLGGASGYNTYLIDEWAYKGRLAHEFAGAVKSQLLSVHGLTPQELRILACGRDCFAKQPISGKTIADVYFSEGFNITPASVDRVQGASLMRRSLKTGRFIISDSCEGLITTLPLLQRDPRNPDDVKKWNSSENDYDKQTGDDFYDAGRYFLSTAPANITPIEALNPREFNYYSDINI